MTGLSNSFFADFLAFLGGAVFHVNELSDEVDATNLCTHDDATNVF